MRILLSKHTRGSNNLNRPLRGGLLVYAFPREHRLRQKSDFQAGFAGTKVVCSEMVVYGTPRQDAGPESRVGLIVSRKVHRKAHERNRVKRLLREAFRTQVQSRTDETDGTAVDLLAVDLVVIARGNAVGASSQMLAKSLCQCVERIRRQFAREQLKRA